MDEIRAFALASGSSGNATLVQANGTNLLIDAGLSARTLAGWLKRHGVESGNLHGILLTHEHQDHATGASVLARRMNAPVFASQGTLSALAERASSSFSSHVLPPNTELALGNMVARAFPIPHDATEPTGFVIQAGSHKIFYATDIGCVTEAVRDAMQGANLVILEANHDLDWLWRGSYTREMKARVSSSTGHLSNADCAEALAEKIERDGPCSVWLAHLSQANNAPSLARRTVQKQIQERTRVPFFLDIALRDSPSAVWKAGAQAFQLGQGERI